MTTASFDLSGDVRSTVPIGATTGVDHDGDLSEDFDAWRTAAYATTDTLDRHVHDIGPDATLTAGVRCACGFPVTERLGSDDDPPDPDRYGNRRVPYRCPDCGDRATLVTGGPEPPIIDEGWDLVD
jgi:hypothetical protein